MKRFISVTIFLAFALAVFSQPAGYYDPATGKTGAELKTALYNIIKGHTSISYDGLWTAFQTTDKKANGKVWDMYSNIEFTFGSNQCGNYSGEGSCYNREHSFPKSWFSEATPMYTDLFHLYPTDGYVNGRRSNYPFGEVSSPTYTSGNGSKLGTCSYPGYTGVVFEPNDEYKGDFARTYFYMVTRYENVVSGWNTDMLDGSAFPAFSAWAKNMLLEWSQHDPVSQKEIDRNNAVYAIQHNRNPYIDHPEYATSVWGGELQLAFTSSAVTNSIQGTAYGYNISAQGSSGSTITISCPTKPTWLIFSNTTAGHATLAGIPSASDLGYNHVILSLTDGTNTVQQDFVIVVSASLPLGFSSTPITDATQGIEYVYNITAQGPSGTTYTITCPTKPSWLTLQNISNGVAKLSGVPAVSDIGDNDVVLAISDGTSTVNQEFTVSVAENTIVPGGTETFTNAPDIVSAYNNTSWTGDDGSTWTATSARTDQFITAGNKAICLKGTSGTYVQSGTLTGGCGSITFKTIQAFTGSGGTLTLYINGNQVGSPFTFTTTLQPATFSNINVSGSFVIKIVNNSTNRPIIDDVSWTGYSGSSENVLFSITNISMLPLEPTIGQPVTISATITDSDGTIQEAYLNWGTVSGNLPNKISMTLNASKYEGIIPSQTQVGSIYFTVSGKDNLGGVNTSAQSNYSVSTANILPSITNVTIIPQNPTTGQAVNVSSTITDSDGTIQEAWVNWGDALNNQPNRVDMVLASGKYEATIPAQAQAGTVYLSVNAKDNLLATSSTPFNYSVTPATYDDYEENNSKVKIYPNPAKNQITIEVVGLMVNNIMISNIIGEKVNNIPYSGSKQSIDISGLKPGIYFVVIIGDGFKNTSRIIIY